MADRLYRSRSDRMLAGVAGGLAEMWGADPSLVRIVWALLVVLTGGVALVVYIVMAIVVPEDDEVWPATAAPPPRRRRTRTRQPPTWRKPAARTAGPADSRVRSDVGVATVDARRAARMEARAARQAREASGAGARGARCSAAGAPRARRVLPRTRVPAPDRLRLVLAGDARSCWV